jgi:SAM-dependent methyltransferase
MPDNALPSSSEEPGVEYGKSYREWKNWEFSNFGELGKSEKCYFDAEIKKANINTDRKMHVLEIGFGNGSFLTYARKKRWDIVGTEINKDLVEAARRLNFNSICADDLSKFTDDTFDLVVAFDVLEHIGQGDLLIFLREVNRILKDGGTFIARFPNGDSPFGLLNQNGDMTHITTIGSGKVKYLASELGVDLVFVGAEAQPLITGTLRRTIHGLFSIPIKKIINIFVNLVFFQGGDIAFCSLNLVMIFRTSKSTPSQL